MKYFNTTAVCVPENHYMVNISDKVEKIKKLVDAKKYFTINRARQYGKTTTLSALYQVLLKDYVVLFLDFQGLDKDVFENGAVFSQAMARLIMDLNEFEDVPVPENVMEALNDLNSSDSANVKMDDLFRIFKRWIKQSDRPVVLIIDEVDSASNNQVFLDFLAQLRDGYIRRNARPVQVPVFHSVILAGVTDIKHLKAKIRSDEAVKENSPWNIAADFDIDMSLSEEGIRGMLDEYESDHLTGMDTAYIAKLIHDETSGYPFLVSRICQIIDEKISEEMPLAEAWTRNGFLKAVKSLLAEDNLLFQTLTKNLNNNPELKESIKKILMEGEKMIYNAQNKYISEMQMYGFIKNVNNYVAVANRTFETMLYNLFMSEVKMEQNVFGKNADLERSRFIKNGKLDMPAIFEGFIKTYNQVVEKLVDRFREEEGREFFLLYLKPIINGTGNFYIESQTRDQLRTDVIVDYLGEQYIIELKIWHGPRYNAEGEAQIRKYLDRFGLQTGYMLSFNFNENKEQGVKEIEIDGKKLIEATV